MQLLQTAKEVQKPSVSAGVLSCLSFAIERKAPAGGNKRKSCWEKWAGGGHSFCEGYVNKIPPKWGIDVFLFSLPLHWAVEGTCCSAGENGLPRMLCTLAMTGYIYGDSL